jgi:hypothetical protein
MRVLVKKMSSLGILKLQMLIGAIVMLAVVILLPASIMMEDVSLILNPYVLGAVVIGMLMFGSFAYFLFMRPYFLYRKSPEVLAETDGEYLYIHGIKEAKILLSEISEAMVFVKLPYIYSNEFVSVLLIHLFSEKYGDLVLEIPGHGNYKLRFVSNVQSAANELTRFMEDVMHQA